MGKATTTDDEFLQLCARLKSAAKVAKALGVTERNVYKRRRAIEQRTGTRIEFEGNSPVHRRIREMGFGDRDWSVAWDKTDDLSILLHNPLLAKEDYQVLLKEAVADIKKVAPRFPAPRFRKAKDGHLLIINITDLHVGGWPIAEAVEMVERVVGDCLTRVSGYNIERILFVTGSDLLHTDNIHYTTSKGTPQVTDGSSWAQAFKAAQQANTKAIATLAGLAPVRVIHISGNHDEFSSWALAQVLEATFCNARSVEFDVSDHPRKYHRFGNALLVFTHGQKVKPADLPMIVSHEAAEEWGRTRWRYVYMGHHHHARQMKWEAIKGHPGITLQWLRSPKPSDAWHRSHGYLASRGVSSFLVSPTDGQVATFEINVEP